MCTVGHIAAVLMTGLVGHAAGAGSEAATSTILPSPFLLHITTDSTESLRSAINQFLQTNKWLPQANHDSTQTTVAPMTTAWSQLVPAWGVVDVLLSNAGHRESHFTLARRVSPASGIPRLRPALAFRCANTDGILARLSEAGFTFQEMTPGTFRYRARPDWSCILHTRGQFVILATDVPYCRALAENLPHLPKSRNGITKASASAMITLDGAQCREFLQDRISAEPEENATRKWDSPALDILFRVAAFHLLEQSVAAHIRNIEGYLTINNDHVRMSGDLIPAPASQLERLATGFSKIPIPGPSQRPLRLPSAAFSATLLSNPSALAEWHAHAADTVRLLGGMVNKQAADALALDLQKLLAQEHGYRTVSIIEDGTTHVGHVIHCIPVENGPAYMSIHRRIMTTTDKLTGSLRDLLGSKAPLPMRIRLNTSTGLKSPRAVDYNQMKFELVGGTGTNDDKELNLAIEQALETETLTIAATARHCIMVRGPKGVELLDALVEALRTGESRSADLASGTASLSLQEAFPARMKLGDSRIRVIDSLKIAVHGWAIWTQGASSEMAAQLLRVVPNSRTPIYGMIEAVEGTPSHFAFDYTIPALALREVANAIASLPFEIDWN